MGLDLPGGRLQPSASLLLASLLLFLKDYTTIVHRTRFDLSTSDWFRADCEAGARDPGKPAMSQ